MVLDKDYRELSQDVYRVDSLKDGHTLKTGDLAGNNNFKILEVEGNTANGMQVMAVAPVDKKGHVDTSQVVIAYAGTNFLDPKDVDTVF